MPDAILAAAAAVTDTAVPALAVDTSEIEASISPSALKARLEQKERAVLKELGFADLASAKAVKAERDELKAKMMSSEERSAARLAELELAAKERDALLADLSEHAVAELAKLTDAQRELILDAAPRSPAKQLRLVEKLRALAPAAQAEVAKPLPVAASTSSASAPPAPATPAEQNVLATYNDLLNRSPVRAAEYRLANWDAYIRASNARA